jgi:hypothetical protein
MTTTAAEALETPKPPAFTWRRLFDLPAQVGWRDHVIGFALAVPYVAWLLATARSLGFARDEGFYFRAGADYWRWFDLLFTRPSDAFKRSAIDSVWQENHEHPSLVKSTFAFSWHFFHQKWHVFDDASTAFRFPAMCFMGLAIWVTYLFGARAYSRRAGVIAAALLALMPRVFYNAHLACFDVPIMAMWAWCIYVYWRATQERGIAWAIATGVVYGFTLDTKHNAWFLPLVIVPHALWTHRRETWKQLRAGRLSLPATLIAMVTIGPLVFLSLWPWMWNDTSERLQEWFNFMTNHAYYNMEFLHVNYFSAPSPRGYMPVMILATVPAVSLALFAFGGVSRLAIHWKRVQAWVRSIRGDRSEYVVPPEAVETDLLFFLAFAVALAPWLLPHTPIFGGTKHWFPAYPFMMLFAGYGFDRIADALTRALPAAVASDRVQRAALQGALVASVVAAPLAVTAHSHPFGLSSYVPLVGGTAGGADLGLNRQFWGFTTESLEPWLEKNAPRGASFYFHDTSYDAWARLIDEHRIRPDLRGTGSESDAQIAIVHLERHMVEVEYQLWGVFGTDAPTYVLTHDGVPIIDLFMRKR